VVAAALSAVLVRFIGSKFTIAVGLALIAAGLWEISDVSITTTFGDTVAGMILLGAGAGLTLPTATASVVGSVPAGDTGVASAANDTAIQLGGAVGVAVIGSVLSTRYQDRIGATLVGQHLSQQIVADIQGSLGGALAVAAQAPKQSGELLARAARSAFASGMDLGALVTVAVALAGCLFALALLPNRPPAPGEDDE
jgi:hypothetical protein